MYTLMKAAVAIASVAVTSVVPLPAGAGASSLAFQPCTEEVEAGLQCATLQVPLDYDQPAGQQISIAVVRHPATDTAHRLGSLFWNPGGPGGSGTQSLAAVLEDFTPYQQAHFDIVSFDPRGIGESTPLRCFASYADEVTTLAKVPAALTPANAAEEQGEIEAWAAFDRACAKHGGPVQYHMGTADVARDMDRIRAGIGDQQVSFDGTSYGTYLGVVYANLFPSRIAHMVLDGNVDPNDWNDTAAGQTTSVFDRLNSPLGGELGFQTFISECASAGASRCSFAAGSYAATLSKWRTLRERLRTKPVIVGGVPFNAQLLETTTFSQLESVQPAPGVGLPGWSALAATLQSVWTASTSPSGTASSALLRRMVKQGPSRPGLAADGYPAAGGAESTYGVLCGETPNPTDPASYAQQAARANAQQSPDGAGGVWTWIAEPCAQWQARNADEYRGPWTRLPASKYLVVGTLADSNTAYTSSLEMAEAIGGARLLTETGGGHTALLNQSTCVNNALDRFYATGALPPAGTVCDQDKPPF